MVIDVTGDGMAKISVIVPVYKVENYLQRCVDSILTQTYRDFELILVDDGSPDSSGTICDRYAQMDDRIRVLHQKNGGAAAARNAGLDLASGEWIAFVDSDDWIHPQYLSILFQVAIQEGADVVTCRYELVKDSVKADDNEILPEIVAEDKEEYWVHDRMGAVVPWGKLFHHEQFANLRFPEGITTEDEYVTYKVLFECNTLIVLNNSIYRYFVNPNSVSRSDYLRRLPDILGAFKLHENYFRNSPWHKVYRLEAELYAAAWSDAIWITKKGKDEESKRRTKQYRDELRQYLETHKALIPFEKRKDIYISAYPRHEWFIRGFGFLKGLIKYG